MTKVETLRELARYQKAAASDEVAWVMAHTDFAALADEVERLTEALADANTIIRMTRQHLAADHPECAYEALGVMNDASRAALAAAEEEET